MGHSYRRMSTLLPTDIKVLYNTYGAGGALGTAECGAFERRVQERVKCLENPYGSVAPRTRTDNVSPTENRRYDGSHGPTQTYCTDGLTTVCWLLVCSIVTACIKPCGTSMIPSRRVSSRVVLLRHPQGVYHAVWCFYDTRTALRLHRCTVAPPQKGQVSSEVLSAARCGLLQPPSPQLRQR